MLGRLATLGILLIAGCSGERREPKAAPKGGSPFETFSETTPKVGEAAPGFELMDSEGVAVKLSDATARGPVVLVFGSFT
jgi:hypothetical protein